MARTVKFYNRGEQPLLAELTVPFDRYYCTVAGAMFDAPPDPATLTGLATYEEYAPFLQELILKRGLKNLRVVTDEAISLCSPLTLKERRLGYTADHHHTFNVADVIDTRTGALKQWVRFGGRRYYTEPFSAWRYTRHG